MIRIALPSKGRLQEKAVALLRDCGYFLPSRRKGELKITDRANEVEFFFLRPTDIPVFVARGTFSAGITGADFVAESGVELSEVLSLGFGGSKLRLAVPSESGLTARAELEGKRVATSFPRLTQAFFGDTAIDPVVLDGSVEIAVELGIADAVVDLVETGRTLAEAGMHVIEEPLFASTASVFSRPDQAGRPEVRQLVRRLRGRLMADRYVMIEYDVAAESLDAACQITPGIASPTIAPLQKDGWYAVRAMTERSDMHEIMDRLSDLGCRGIVALALEHSRPTDTT